MLFYILYSIALDSIALCMIDEFQITAEKVEKYTIHLSFFLPGINVTIDAALMVSLQLVRKNKEMF